MESDLRKMLHRLLGMPDERGDLLPERRGEVVVDGVRIEKWLFTAEAGSRIPANLYVPADMPTGAKLPAIVMTCGHGDSKGVVHMTYVARVYARLGVACLLAEPLGEGERYPDGSLGTRHHDRPQVAHDTERAGRSVMGKFIFDAMRGIDFLETFDWLDCDRIGAAGNSLGGSVAMWLFSLEPRLRATIVSGWAYTDDLKDRGKHCSTVPIRKMRSVCDWQAFMRLSSERNALLVMNGDADVVIDKPQTGRPWRDTVTHLEAFDPKGERTQYWFCPGGGHRPYQGHRRALAFITEHLGPLGMATADIDALPDLHYGTWCDAHGVELEQLYGTELHYRGAILPDFGFTPIAREDLGVLTPDELGGDDFTIDGWLKAVASA